MGLMSTYVRPEIESEVYRDPAGHVIDYGNRWGMSTAPEETYSIVTDPQRFHPLHDVANALIDHVAANFDVTVHDDRSYASDLLVESSDVVRAVRIVPHDPRSAAVTFVFTSFPGLKIHIGQVHDLSFPVCGCDACDDSWELLTEEMEWHILAVFDGGFSEDAGLLPRPWVSSRLQYAGGSTGGRVDAEDIPLERIRDAETVLATLDGRWAPWPPLIELSDR